MKKLTFHFSTVGTATDLVVDAEQYSEVDWGEGVIALTCQHGKDFKVYMAQVRYVEVEDYEEE